MTLFSQRQGIRPIAKALQKESMDDDLRNLLWSVLFERVWYSKDAHIYGWLEVEVGPILRRLWLRYFKKPIDTKPHDEEAIRGVRVHFFAAEWWQVYDLIECTLMSVFSEDRKARIKETLNAVLQIENSAYRIVGGEVVEITDDHEIEAIESALAQQNKPARSHLSQALALLSDRKQPDYRNSIKESISAVEAICQLVAGKPKATLGACLGELKKKGTLHPALERAMSNLYGYTSDEGGIRHALTEDSVVPSYSEAKFMLVVCSAFVNFALLEMEKPTPST